MKKNFFEPFSIKNYVFNIGNYQFIRDLRNYLSTTNIKKTKVRYRQSSIKEFDFFDINDFATNLPQEQKLNFYKYKNFEFELLCNYGLTANYALHIITEIGIGDLDFLIGIIRADTDWNVNHQLDRVLFCSPDDFVKTNITKKYPIEYGNDERHHCSKLSPIMNYSFIKEIYNGRESLTLRHSKYNKNKITINFVVIDGKISI